jgi:plasmid stabilization system protein ParE
MSRGYEISPLARADLDQIADHIALDNRHAADRLLEKLRSRFALLARQPFFGETRSDLREDLRGTHIGNYAIYYRLVEDDARVEIVRVIHASRDTREML